MSSDLIILKFRRLNIDKLLTWQRHFYAQNLNVYASFSGVYKITRKKGKEKGMYKITILLINTRGAD